LTYLDIYVKVSFQSINNIFNIKQGVRVMARICFICEKGTTKGRSIKRRGMAKKKGGAGRKITGVSKRTFKPNLQKIRAEIDGKIRKITVCTKCLKSGKVKKVV